MTREEAFTYRRIIERAVASLDDTEAVTAPLLFQRWDSFTAFTSEDVTGKIRVVGDDGRLYRVITAHTRQDDWKPSLTPTLFELVEGEDKAGTVGDPIEAAVGLRYYKGKYYSEEGRLYLCIRDDSNGEGTVLYYLPSQLAGNYFEEVSES